MKDRIRLKSMQFYGHHGVDAAERDLGGRFAFDIELVRDLTKPGQSDDLNDTVDYKAVYDLVADERSTHDLAQQRPGLVREFERIFREARVNSKWYINPGESREQIAEKERRAAATGQLIQLVPPNHRSEKSR